MATRLSTAITEEPRRCKGLDKNRIVFKGVCHTRALQSEEYLHYANFSELAPTHLGVMCSCLFCACMGTYCGLKAAKQWRLYLTPSAIHYLKQGTLNMNSKMRAIPLMYIEDISVFDKTSIMIARKTDDSNAKGSIITIHHCENADEFVAAVKQQLGRA